MQRQASWLGFGRKVISMLSDRPDPQKILGANTIVWALIIHFAFFAFFWVFAVCNGLFNKKEEIVPIDLTVVVVENLDGNEDEPPPLQKPEPPPPPPPKPKSKPKAAKPKEPEKPKELERIVTNIVVKVDKKKEKEEKKEKKADKKPDKPEKPQKTAKEIREERIKRIRQSAKDVRTKPQPNGRTDPKTLSDVEIKKLLNIGYKPGRSTNLAPNVESLAYSLIKDSFESKWDKPPWTDTLKPMVVRVWFGGGGRIVKFKLESSSGDASADRTILSAASRVGVISALPAEFIDKYKSRGVPIRFTVTPQ